MLFADLRLEYFLSLLGQYNGAAYPVLFLGSFFETLVPFSLVVYGEFFFIGGAVLAGIGKLDIWGVAAVLYGGGILGDNSSYWLGRRYGMQVFEVLCRWPFMGRFFHEDMRCKGTSFFYRRGEAAVFFARLSGPFSWVIPAMAGMFQQRYSRFIFFNTLGIFVGIGEFLVVGYLLGNNLDRFTLWLTKLGYIPIGIIVSLVAVFLWSYFAGGKRVNLKK